MYIRKVEHTSNILFNPIPGRLKKSKNGQGGVNFTPLPHFGHCSQNYISDSHVYFFVGKLDKF